MNKETLRKVQLTQLEIAKEVKRLCTFNNISYFLDSGTLLGAVRHKGFIPWDDDMDLGMLRSDYEKFIKVAKKDLSPDFRIVDWYSYKDYSRPFCKIEKAGTIYLEEGAQQSKHEGGIYIDIFPYDVFPDTIDRAQKTRINLLKAIIRNRCGIKTWVDGGKINYSRYIKNIPSLIVGKTINLKRAKMIYDSNAIKHNSEYSQYYFPQGISGYGTWLIPRSCLQKTETLLFEGVEFSVPLNSDLYLKQAYGDYMTLPPVDQRENRHKIIRVDFGN